ncbi:hypothetical protein AC579_4478 [Pseudocercospora musae]|uniref:Uncharacterized protein n=1 Tax=Pseudocercospora musae TaxID=113226 RepID=A0A139GWJ5_9PEZI|nr:hypothetical protein AC579_4478 [Pseudocercospora musae]
MLYSSNYKPSFTFAFFNHGFDLLKLTLVGKRADFNGGLLRITEITDGSFHLGSVSACRVFNTVSLGPQKALIAGFEDGCL